MTKRNSRMDPAGSDKVGAFDELQQPLTAACNYLGAARLLLASSDRDRAIRNLDNVEIQVLRAADMIRRFQASDPYTSD